MKKKRIKLTQPDAKICPFCGSVTFDNHDIDQCHVRFLNKKEGLVIWIFGDS